MCKQKLHDTNSLAYYKSKKLNFSTIGQKWKFVILPNEFSQKPGPLEQNCIIDFRLQILCRIHLCISKICIGLTVFDYKSKKPTFWLFAKICYIFKWVFPKTVTFRAKLYEDFRFTILCRINLCISKSCIELTFLIMNPKNGFSTISLN